MPKISILLPTYNGEKCVKLAIESVLAQDFFDWELIVLDDGSKDGTEKIIAEYMKKDSRIIFIKQSQNLGLQKNLNSGIRIAKGEYIARIDQDDEWLGNDKLKKQLDFLEKNRGYVLVGTGAVLYSEEGGKIGEYHMPLEDNDIRMRMLARNCFLHPSILARKDSLLKVGLYNEDSGASYVEDYDLWLRLGMVGKIANINKTFLKIVVHSGSMTADNRVKQAYKILRLIFHYRKDYPNFLGGFFVSLFRLKFFILMSLFPFKKSLIYRLQVFYKNI